MNPFLALEIGWLRHPKVRKVHRDARSLWIAAGLYAVENATDGAVPKPVIALLAREANVHPRYALSLVDSGLWHDCGDHYLIHDFLDRNTSKDQREAERNKWRTQKQRQRSTAMSTADSESCPPRSPPRTSARTSAFDDFWTAYPKKVGKGESRLLWKKMTQADRRDALAGAARHAAAIDAHPGRFALPAGDVWLRQRRWEDDEPKRVPTPDLPERHAPGLAGLRNGMQRTLDRQREGIERGQ